MHAVGYDLSSEMSFASEELEDYWGQLVEKRLVGISRWSERARKLILWHASHDNIVSLEGEPGTGKTLLAALIHQCSARREAPFVRLAVASASVDVARSVLHSSVNVSSTEESADAKGLIELAREGTLYIDGLSHAPDSSPMVESILDLLSRSRFSNRGENRARVLLGWTTHSQSRFPAGAGKDNSRDSDTISIPPLRERAEDVEALAIHFVKLQCALAGKETRTLAPEALITLRSYDWPQNVRELESLIRVLVNEAGPPTIDASLLPSYLRIRADHSPDSFPVSGIDLSKEIRRREMELICAALRHSRGMQSNAARLLHIKPTTLFMKIQRYGINVEAFR